jgi:hypothetical protein
MSDQKYEEAAMAQNLIAASSRLFFGTGIFLYPII